MSSYVVEGKAMWSHLVTPFDTFGNDCYQIYLSADDKTMLRFADKGIDVKSVLDEEANQSEILGQYSDDNVILNVRVRQEIAARKARLLLQYNMEF